jgi:hypothetical protein
MAERLKAPASKAGRDLRLSRVRISLSPPFIFFNVPALATPGMRLSVKNKIIVIYPKY